MEDLLAIAEDAARAAGDVLLARFRAGSSGVATKSTSTDMVSDADREAERVILEIIGRTRHDDGVLAEETGEQAGSSGYRWVIDPLDGTTNFLYGVPHWAVSIAVEDAGGVCAAVVHDPIRRETFAASRGRATTLNGEQVRVTRAQDLQRALIATGFSYRPTERAAAAGLLTQVLPKVRDIRRAGAAALDLAWVACGRYDGYYESPIEWWDMAAGTLLVIEAGGRCGMLPPVGTDEGRGYIATGPGIYDGLLELVMGAIG